MACQQSWPRLYFLVRGEVQFRYPRPGKKP
jgi:hypothetical protein